MDLFQNCLTAGLSWLQQVLVYVVGYSVSVMAGSVATGSVIETIPKDAGGNASRESSTLLLGVVEAAIYTTVWVIGKEVFIPVWLGLKASQYWGKLSLHEVRPIFNRWLIGTGLSLAYGVAGGVLITRMNSCEFLSAALQALLLGVATWGLVLYANMLTRPRVGRSH